MQCSSAAAVFSAVYAAVCTCCAEILAQQSVCADGSEWRQRIEQEAEHFLDVSAWSVGDIASKISSDEIQVAINLNGYTKGARNEIFALLPAPVQTSYMGFPATTGTTTDSASAAAAEQQTNRQSCFLTYKHWTPCKHSFFVIYRIASKRTLCSGLSKHVSIAQDHVF